MKKTGMGLLSIIVPILLLFFLIGCADVTDPDVEDPNDLDEPLPLDFPVYPDADMVNHWEDPYCHFVFATSATCDEITDFYVETLREDGWYVTTGECTGFVCADQACNIYVVDAREELIAVIAVYREAEDRDEDGYTIMFGKNVRERAERLEARPPDPIDVEVPGDLPSVNDLYLVDHEVVNDDRPRESFYYRMEMDCVCPTGLEALFEDYKEALEMEGWTVTRTDQFPGQFLLEAQRNDRELAVLVDGWQAAGVLIGARLGVTVYE